MSEKEQGDETSGFNIKQTRISAESDEVMLSDMQSGEETSPGDTNEYEYGDRDEDAALDYAKKTTTTETGEEEPSPEEGDGYTTPPPPQDMVFKSNVVPAPSPTGDSTGDPTERDSRLNSEEMPEVSVGNPEPLGELEDEPEHQEGRRDLLSEETPTEQEGSVKVHSEVSGRGSSLSFDHSSGKGDSSPVMFSAGDGKREESPLQSPSPDMKEGTEEDVLGPEGSNSQPKEPVLAPAPEKERLEAMDEPLSPRLDHPTGQRARREESPQETTDPPPASESIPTPSSSAAPDLTARKKPTGPMLPPRRGTAPAAQRSGSGSTGSQSPNLGSAPAQLQRPPNQPPAGMGSLPPLRPPAVDHSAQQRPNIAPIPSNSQIVQPNAEPNAASEPPEVIEARRKLLDIRLNVLRVANRLGMRPLDFAITDFMSKIDRTEQLRFRGAGAIRPQIDTLFNQAASLDERSGLNSNLEITVTAIVIGPAGSGKSSVIQNLLHPGFGLAPSFADGPTDKIEVYTNRVCGVNFKLIDTPGLSVAASALRKNMNILKAVRGAISKHKPDTVIYVDRMDLFRRELSDIPLLRLVNDMLPELLYNCVALLTRAGAPPPDAGNGQDMPYMEYQRLRLDLCTQIISHAISDMRWAGRPMGFENHPNCNTNSEGAPILPSNQPFKKHAIFQLVTSHMSGEMEKVCKTRQLRQNTMAQMLYMMQPRKQLQLSALVAQLLAPKPPRKFPDEERDLCMRNEIGKIASEAEKVEEENKRRDYTRMRKVEILQEEAHPSQVPIVGASMELNPTFDHDVNQHRYNATDFVYGWSVRPIMSAQDNVYEHDDGVEMFQIARDGVLRRKGRCVDGVPFSMIVQAGKGKNFSNIQMDTGASHHIRRNLVATGNLVVHPAGTDGEVVYTPTLDIRAKIADRDKLTIGGMACRLAETGLPHKGQLGLGGKIENKYKIKEGVKVTGSVGAMTVKPSANQARDVAYGANMEVKLAGGKGEYDPNFLLSAGLSHQRRGAFKRTGLSGQISGEQAISPETMINARLQMSAGGSGTASLRMITHDKPQTGWLMAVPLAIKAVKRIMGHGDEYV